MVSDYPDLDFFTDKMGMSPREFVESVQGIDPRNDFGDF